MDVKAITIAIESCETDEYVISGAGIKTDDALKSVSIVWNADAKGEAPAPLPDKVRIKALRSVISELQDAIFSATLVVSKHDFDLLRNALDASARRLTITDGAFEFSCKKVTDVRAVLAKVAETSALTLTGVKTLEKEIARVHQRIDALVHALPPKTDRVHLRRDSEEPPIS